MGDAGATQTHLRLIGMTCGACAARIEKALRAVDGVDDASVNLLTESAAVRVPAASRHALLTAVRNAGYDAEIMPVGGSAAERFGDPREQHEKLRRHRQALIQAIM